MSPHGLAAVAALELDRFWPGAAREAYDTWMSFLRDPHNPIFEPDYGCGERACCPDPHELIPVLHAVARAVPRRDAAAFHRLLTALAEPP